MNTFSHVPPGFRFHPTDEELVDYYLRKKVASRRIELDVIKDVDLYKIEPWDIQEICRLGTEEVSEWYFFSHKDKKYPTGTRTNRATASGFWKATGRDKAIYSKHNLIGMRKTLVFYQGRAPNGQKSDWIMHEYRLETDENGAPQEEGWVVCRVFKKRVTSNNVRKTITGDQESPCWYDEHASFMQMDLESPKLNPNSMMVDDSHHLPLLESPRIFQTSSFANLHGLEMNHTSTLQQSSSLFSQEDYNVRSAVDQVMDWRVLDKFVASQLSQEDVPKECNNQHSNSLNKTFPDQQMNNVLVTNPTKQEIFSKNANDSCSYPIDQWK